MSKTQQPLEEIKTELAGLKIRLRRIEQFLLSLPNADEYIQDRTESEEDGLFEEAKKLLANFDMASASLLQRRLTIGYARAARLIDQLEEAGVISSTDGTKPRQVLIKK